MSIWLSILLWALLNAPQIISVLKQLWDLIHHPSVDAVYTEVPGGSEAVLKAEFADFKKTRDPRGLCALRDRWQGLKAAYDKNQQT